jgi:hypothetical protein
LRWDENIRPADEKPRVAAMQINPSSGFTGVSPTAPGAPSASGGSKSGARVDSPAGGEDSTFTPTADLARLLESVRQLPDVRPEAVSAATDLVTSGELFTTVAAADTAQAVLASQVRGD